MAALRSSALMGWSVWTCLLLVLVRCVGPVLVATLEIKHSPSVMVCPTLVCFLCKISGRKLYSRVF